MTTPDRSHAPATRRANVRTAAVLASIAVVFFLGVIAARVLGADDAGLMVLGGAVIVFLVVAIGRNLASRR